MDMVLVACASTVAQSCWRPRRGSAPVQVVFQRGLRGALRRVVAHMVFHWDALRAAGCGTAGSAACNRGAYFLLNSPLASPWSSPDEGKMLWTSGTARSCTPALSTWWERCWWASCMP